jgi:hypothetical protein
MRSKRFILGSALLALAVALWYLGQLETKPLATSPQPEAVQPSSSETPPVASQPPVSSKSTSDQAASAPMSAPAPKPDGLALWEIKIDEALRSNAEPPAIGKMLLQQINGMPGEGQAASARHIANLLADEDYLSVLPYVQNTRLDPGFQEVIVAESLNRSEEVKLPVLLAAARTPNHPMAEIAKSTLGFLLENNFENDWGRWEAAVKEALAKKAASQ